jgi:ubiquinone/menaquinone biosynthesis C-methylase UbiE
MDEDFLRIRAAYDLVPEREWDRLESGAQFRLEHLITAHVLEQHLPAPDRSVHVLDAGGGPGRYTVALAGRGYAVTLLDLSPGLLDLARRRISESPPDVQQRVEAVVEGSITDLSRFPDAGFDAVLCLGGPLSHVVEAEQRRQALAELRRVALPGAPVFVSVMNRFGAYRSAVQWPSCYEQFFPHLPETGTADIGAGAPTYFFRPEEFVDELTRTGLRVEHVYGCNGIGAHLDEDNLLALMGDQARWPPWRDQLLATCDHPNVIGASNHILAVARSFIP